MGPWSLQLQRLYWRRRAAWGKGLDRAQLAPLLEVWQQSPLSVGRPVTEQEFLVLDAETSGLDVNNSELLSLGWVVIRNGRVSLKEAEHRLIRPQQGVGDSARIHYLRDCELEDGEDISQVMAALMAAAAGRVLVFHHAPLDIAFLNRACRRCCGAPLLMPYVDTLAIEQRMLQRRHVPLVDGVLKLSRCCARYQLPPFQLHNALTDALATAQLLLAQIAHKGGEVRLRQLL